MDRRSLLHWLGVTALVACTPSTEPEVPDEPQAAPEPERDAHRRAARAVGARITVHVYMDRVRTHPVAPRIGALSVVNEAFEGTDIDPVKDVNRAFIAAANAKSDKDAMAVAEHALPEERVRQAIGVLVTRSGSDGSWMKEYPFPAARVMVRKRKTVVMAVTPTLLVVTSPSHARAAAKLRKSAGLPEPSGPEAVDIHADDPSTSLKVRGAPPVPPTMRYVSAKVVLLSDGDAELNIDGESSDSTQAQADAAQLTKDVEAATTVDMGILKFRAFQPIAFTAEGNMVKARRHVTRAELDSLLSMAALMMG